MRAPTCFWGRQKLGNAIPGMIFCDGRRNNDERGFPKSSPKSYPPRYHGPAAAPKTQGGGQIDTRAQQDVPFPRAAVARVCIVFVACVVCARCVCCVRFVAVVAHAMLCARPLSAYPSPNSAWRSARRHRTRTANEFDSGDGRDSHCVVGFFQRFSIF